MNWWIWILVGVGLMAFEVVIPGGIIMLFFGVSGVVVGLLTWAGLGGPLWFQILLFSVLSIVSLLTLRGPIVRRVNAPTAVSDRVDSLVGAKATALGDLAPGSEGQAELRGTAWTAINAGDSPIARGARCTVERVEGLTLFVR